jgi:excisionase family DNA binding protein
MSSLLAEWYTFFDFKRAPLECESNVEPKWYTRSEAAERLGVDALAPSRLSTRGLLKSNGLQKSQQRFDASWVDEIAALIAMAPPQKNYDQALFELYALYREYHTIPEGVSRGGKDMHHARVQKACQEIVVAGRLWTLEQLAEQLNMRVERLRGWVTKNRLCALRLGQRTYLTARYGRFVVHVVTKWLTVDEAAEKWRITPGTINKWISHGGLDAIRLPDGMRRIEPKVLERYMNARASQSDDTAMPLDVAAAFIGCTYASLRSNVSDGTVKSEGFGGTRRIPKEEVLKLHEWFNNLNAEFRWLQPLLRRPVSEVQTLTAQQTARILKVGPGAITLWSQNGLLPFVPLSFMCTGSIIRKFVRLYIVGLSAYADGGKVARHQVRAYKKLCQEKGNIV